MSWLNRRYILIFPCWIQWFLGCIVMCVGSEKIWINCDDLTAIDSHCIAFIYVPFLHTR